MSTLLPALTIAPAPLRGREHDRRARLRTLVAGEKCCQSGRNVGESLPFSEGAHAPVEADEQRDLLAGVVGALKVGSLPWSAVIMSRSSGDTLGRKPASHPSKSRRALA